MLGCGVTSGRFSKLPAGEPSSAITQQVSPLLGTFTSQALAAVFFPTISTVVPVVKVDITLKFVLGPDLHPMILLMNRVGLVVGVTAGSAVGVLFF